MQAWRFGASGRQADQCRYFLGWGLRSRATGRCLSDWWFHYCTGKILRRPAASALCPRSDPPLVGAGFLPP